MDVRGRDREEALSGGAWARPKIDEARGAVSRESMARGNFMAFRALS